MLTDTNKRLVRRLLQEALGEGNYELLYELLDKNYVNHTPQAGQGEIKGPDRVKQLMQDMRGGIPDLEVHIDEILAEGDRVVVRSTMTGTHRGPLMGVQPTNKPVQFTAIDTFRVQEGRITDAWLNRDLALLLQQIGAIPAS